MYHIFVGYDDRQKEAFQVCKFSIESNSSVPVTVHKLHHKDLRSAGLFTREWKIRADGNYEDLGDGRPFSTQFTFTRFLVPELWRNLPSPTKNSLVMFVDCDWIFPGDVGQLFKEVEQAKLRNGGRPSVYVTQHNYKPESRVKMDGCEQHGYNMKLWAALMVFDMDNSENARLTPDVVNTAGGRELMSFFWIEDKHTIGSVGEEWHFIPNHSEKNAVKEIKGIHLTEGGPWFPHMRNGKFDKLWWTYYTKYLSSKLISFDFKGDEIIDSN